MPRSADRGPAPTLIETLIVLFVIGMLFLSQFHSSPFRNDVVRNEAIMGRRTVQVPETVVELARLRHDLSLSLHHFTQV